MDPITPAVSLEDSVLTRLAEARTAIARLAGHNADPETFRGAVAADVGEALRALGLAEDEVRRAGQVNSAERAHTILDAEVARVVSNAETLAPEIMVVVIPLPIDGTRLPLDVPVNRFSETVNRLALEVQRRDRRYATWLISAPSYSGARLSNDYFEDRQHIAFTVQNGDTLLARLRFYSTGMMVFHRPLWRGKQPGFALHDIEADLNATLLFAREFFLDLGTSPIQVAVALVRRNAGNFKMTRPAMFRSFELMAPQSANDIRVYPSVPALSGYSAFSDDPLALTAKVMRAIECDYEPDTKDTV